MYQLARDSKSSSRVAGYSDESNRSFTSDFVLLLEIGALFGIAISTFLLKQQFGPSVLIWSGLSYAAVGATMGMLLAGLIDVTIRGSLDDKLDDPEEIKPSMQVSNQPETAVVVSHTVSTDRLAS